MKFNRPLVLASSSPRRQYLMKEAGFTFQIEKPDGDESFPPEMPATQVARYLALKKAELFRLKLGEEVIVTADTIVILNHTILNKPADREEAISMLNRLAGNTHLVITGVSIVSKEKEESFEDTTAVTFKKLNRQEIENYVDRYKPFDKAGAYGAQDCLPTGVNPCSLEEIEFLKSINKVDLIQRTFTKADDGSGMVAIEKIDGSYFNVMGLPIHKVYQHLMQWP